MQRYLGIDLGAETVKVVELRREGTGGLRLHGSWDAEHRKDPVGALRNLLSGLDAATVSGVAATGRMSRLLPLHRVPTKAALARGVATARPELTPCTVVSIGSHGFAVLELRSDEHHVWRENSRCSQGTGNFLRQLVERFGLTVEEASAQSARATSAAPLSGRCPVILKTDMTHLANKGEDRAPILAGLYDAVCENVQVLIKPRLSPRQILLTGGVCRAERVRHHFRRFAALHDMVVVDSGPEDLYLEALGAAAFAAEQPVPADSAGRHLLDGLVGLPGAASDGPLDRIPGLSTALHLVHRMPRPAVPDADPTCPVILGFDIGSTGSKAVAFDPVRRVPVWQGYVPTLGNPVEAARGLAERHLRETGRRHPIVGIGATGSGREIVGSLMAACYGRDRVFVLNEIAAHAAGALSYDAAVDTIFEIGGQDAKYVRLEEGRIVDAAMNEACSAGTGSFIEEQGRKFADVRDVARMGELALTASEGVSLGQHCSVFMAEVIDEAVSAGVGREAILAGIYDSVVQNYLNRVKGSRTIGRRIFCQGMPFLSDALAAAVARQTGRTVVVPPDPGTIGALGISILAWSGLQATGAGALDLGTFLGATVESRDSFPCPSIKGCGAPGNRCRVERLVTTVNGRRQRFNWGGNCSLYDSGTGKRKLPDLAPDPFRERRALVDGLLARPAGGRPTVAMTEEFTLKGLLPFVATFVRQLGFDVRVHADAGPSTLKRGIEEANIPFCAPMQIFQGAVAEMLEEEPDVLLLPRLRELPRVDDEVFCKACPIVQGSPDVARTLVGSRSRATLVTTNLDMGPGNMRSAKMSESAQALARSLAEATGGESAGREFDRRWRAAYRAACEAQEEFDRRCRHLGQRALEFARQHDLVPVVVLGRAYTIYNGVLNSNVPSILREQGAIAIPVDCYPIDEGVPVFEDVFWGYTQTNLRAAHQIRRADGVYSVFCSNYSCGPDSFSLHFYAYVMEGKPFAVIETDGHSGDAGTKTRIEAFLHCVDGDRRLDAAARGRRAPTSLRRLESDRETLGDARRRNELVLVPRMGAGAEVVVEALGSEGIRAETLPMPTRETLAIGRRVTSGKECLPMTITAGSMLERLERDRHTSERFAFFMPKGDGPCRFGSYYTLHKILLEKTGWSERVRLLAPADQDYFAEVTPSFQVRVWVAMVASDLLLDALHDVRPVERQPGAARAVYDRAYAELKRLVRATRPGKVGGALLEVAGDMFGVRTLIREAGRQFAEFKDQTRSIPTVAVSGEIYARCDPFASDFIVEKLEARGIRAHVAYFSDWIEYLSWLAKGRTSSGRAQPGESWLPVHVTDAVQEAVESALYREMATALGWGPRTTVPDAVRAATPYISGEIQGEAVLTVGGPLHEYLTGLVDAAVVVGPHECLPNKLAESQFCHIAEDHGLLSLTIPLNGDPSDPEILDRFAFEVHQRFATRGRVGPRPRNPDGLGRALVVLEALRRLTRRVPVTGRAVAPQQG